jgi:hypothetical protein
MSYLQIPAICTLLIVGLPAIAEEPSAQQQINGKCTLTKWVGDDSRLEGQGDIVAIPKGAGYVFHMEEFIVPGEERGSRRYVLPKGVHYRVSPARINQETVVLDVLLGNNVVNTLTDDSFSISTTQTDGRYVVKYGKPFSVSLQLPDSKIRYVLEITLQK